MRSPQHFAVFGFIFGTFGLMVMSMFALMFQAVELVALPFMAPGRYMAEHVMHSQGTNVEVFILVLFNGILYAAAFWAGGKIAMYTQKSGKK